MMGGGTGKPVFLFLDLRSGWLLKFLAPYPIFGVECLMHFQRLLATLGLLILSGSGVIAAAPLKVFILAGQSNMEGQAVVDLAGKDYNDGRGTLLQLLNDPTKSGMLAHLRDSQGQWSIRKDVWVRYQRENAPLLAGPLGVGFSVYGDRHHFGPELQLGHRLGNHYQEQVLLIKTAWGGKSLYQDFRPPSSGGQVGRYYTLMLSQIREALQNLGRDFPSYDGAGYELAGFVWYQGWNDGVDPTHAIPEYRTNLVNLIKDVRRELSTPHLPCVIGELTGPWVDAPREWEALRKAHSEAANDPSLQGGVVFAETRHFVRHPEDSPNPGHGHHEFGNAETYFLVGDALANGMLQLLKAEPSGLPIVQSIEGWTLHIHPTLLSKEKAATDKALSLLKTQLSEIKRTVPKAAVIKLQQIPLWFSPPYPGASPRAEYHPGADWLRDHGRDPAMVKSVEFTNIRQFDQEMNRMPNFALHELAHGYHDRVLRKGFENPEIAAAFQRASVAKSYERVERHHGNGRPNTFERAYAMTNPQEYFAETTEAYFTRNDFFPFTRTQLQRHDPEMAALLELLWNLP